MEVAKRRRTGDTLLMCMVLHSPAYNQLLEEGIGGLRAKGPGLSNLADPVLAGNELNPPGTKMLEYVAVCLHNALSKSPKWASCRCEGQRPRECRAGFQVAKRREADVIPWQRKTSNLGCAVAVALWCCGDLMPSPKLMQVLWFVCSLTCLKGKQSSTPDEERPETSANS
jgi:hypothetical protein